MYSDRTGIRSRAVVTAIAVASALAVASPVAATAPPTFDGDRALAAIRMQCDLGPRVPGSPEIRRLRRRILDAAREAGLRGVTQCFPARLPVTGDTVTICNIVVSAGPPDTPRLWLAAHYDTRPVADQDPDPARRGEPLP